MERKGTCVGRADKAALVGARPTRAAGDRTVGTTSVGDRRARVACAAARHAPAIRGSARQHGIQGRASCVGGGGFVGHR
jgi:hypothetical protein